MQNIFKATGAHYFQDDVRDQNAPKLKQKNKLSTQAIAWINRNANKGEVYGFDFFLFRSIFNIFICIFVSNELEIFFSKTLLHKGAVKLAFNFAKYKKFFCKCLV